MIRRSPATLSLLVVIAIAFLVQIRVGVDVSGGSAVEGFMAASDERVLMETGAAYSAMKDTESWRLVASMFLHAGLLHLAVNLIGLVSIGELLEGMFGSWLLLISWFAGGIVSGAATLMVPEPGFEKVLYVGASGAVCSLAGTLLLRLIAVWRSERKRWSRVLVARLGGCLVFNLGLGLVISAIAVFANLSFTVANVAHVSGFIAGALIGLLPVRIRQGEITKRLERIFDQRDFSR